MKGMILAAGLGTRLKPWTDHHPKALAVVNGKTLLQRNIEYLQRAGIYEVLVNVHHFADQIIKEVQINKGWGSVVSISDETSEVLETGGGLKKAAWYFKEEEDFVVMNADILTDLSLQQMIVEHRQQKPLATLAVSHRNSSRYFLFDANMKLCGWKNVNTGQERIVRSNALLTPFAFSGIHVISSSIFQLMWQEGKFSMIDVYLSLAEKHNIKGYDHTGSALIDVGKPENITKAEALFI
ncbi:MAG: NTP transferase domain-containing protein [Bacteroidota bacterium]|nr:NTP transferase domain-containing protein [Bacteroidota bacterium]